MSKTETTRSVIEGMVDGLNDHRIDDIGQFFADGFRWMGNYGCGTKTGSRNSRTTGTPLPAPSRQGLRGRGAPLHGRMAAAFGRQEATHSGEFMGIAPTGKRVEIRYMDFWKVVDGKIVDNWVMVDFPHVMGPARGGLLRRPRLGSL